MRKLLLSAMCASLCFFGVVASAAPITDPADDFLTTLDPAAPHGGDLDVLSGEGFLIGDNLVLTATLGAPIGTTAAAFYVWGVDRGNGVQTDDFANLGLPGIVFDTVLIVQANETGAVILFTASGTPGSPNVGAPTPLAAGSVVNDGATITVTVPLALLPSNGAAPGQYTWNLWPRWGGAPFGDSQISDFAPDDSMAPVTVVPPPTGVPEPATLMLLGLGLALGGLRRRRM